MPVTIQNAGIDVSITRETRAPSKKGFGILAFVQPVLGITNRVKLYGTPDEVANDYAAGTEAYAAAMAWFSQEPRPQSLIIIQSVAKTLDNKAEGKILFGGSATAAGEVVADFGGKSYGTGPIVGAISGIAATGTLDLSGTPPAAGDGDITLKLNGTDYVITPKASATGTKMAADLVIEINKGTEYTATALNGVLSVSDKTEGAAGNAKLFEFVSADSMAAGNLYQPAGGADVIPGADAGDVAAALALEINQDDKYTATANAGELTVENNVSGAFGNAVTISILTPVAGVTTAITQPSGGTDMIVSEAIGDTLIAAAAVNADFYAVAFNRHYRADSAQLLALAAWAEGNERPAFITTNDAGVADASNTSDIASQLKAAGHQRTYLHYSSHVNEYPEIAAFAILATTSFNGHNTVKTLKFKHLALVTAEAIGADALAAIKRKNANVQYMTAGVSMADDGIMVGGNWLDEIHGADALAEEVRTRVFGLFARTSTKIPYTESGMALIKAEVRGALSQFEGNGFLAEAVDGDGNYLPAFDVLSGAVSKASKVDKANRIAPEVEFWGRLASAIHDVKINGRLVL